MASTAVQRDAAIRALGAAVTRMVRIAAMPLAQVRRWRATPDLPLHRGHDDIHHPGPNGAGASCSAGHDEQRPTHVAQVRIPPHRGACRHDAEHAAETRLEQQHLPAPGAAVQCDQDACGTAGNGGQARHAGGVAQIVRGHQLSPFAILANRT
ncbi:hypothetical protein ACVFYP_15720 [Roseomonas sp. F4]